MSLSTRKDKRVQVYRTVKKRLGNVDKTYRHFIYTESTYQKGGLWAGARELMDAEKIQGDMARENSAVQFTMNRNPNLTTDCVIIYNGQTYAVESIDLLDFRSIDVKVRAKAIKDNNKYAGDTYAK